MIAALAVVVVTLLALTGRGQKYTCVEENRTGDHIGYDSDLRKMRAHHPKWGLTRSLETTIDEIVAAVRQRRL